jgi:4-amino-4-deoxy-L-arabinose transferase-like glycosyltransferase
MKKYAIVFVLLLAFVLRIYGINWDNGLHLHPDERQLILVANTIHFWDQLNPHFFNYGSLPIYMVKGVSQLGDFLLGTHLATYDNMLYVGRTLSIVFDLGTLFLIYLIARSLFKKESVGLFAALLYAISFFPIQNSHFFVVDVFLTFFVTGSFYFLIQFLRKPSYKTIIWISILSAAGIATKISMLIFLPVIITTLFVGLKGKLVQRFGSVLLFGACTLMAYFIFMPYAYLSFSKFTQDTFLQTQMSKDAYIFPYTLQYVYTFPYIYFLKNIFLWGLGPVISFLSIIGTVFSVNHIYEHRLWKKLSKKVIIFAVFAVFYLLYFILIGRSAVKFMRYMLPLYPCLILLAAYAAETLKKKALWIPPIFIVAAFIWTVSFVHIYSVEHTRITATNWILQHIPAGTPLAVEHWDDRLPLMGSELYPIQELTLYDLPDDQVKMQRIYSVLNQSQYIIVASNRLYVPLQKLSDCSQYIKCYPLTAQYYKDLFSGKLGFKKVAEFSDNPKVPLLPISFSDQSADESFTVYDHPKIMIFEKD